MKQAQIESERLSNSQISLEGTCRSLSLFCKFKIINLTLKLHERSFGNQANYSAQ